MNPLWHVQVFYSTAYQVAALLSLLVIFIFCLWSIHSDRVNDGVLGRILYIITAGACAAGLMHMWQGSYPQRTTITIFSAIALLGLRRMFIHYYWDTLRAKYFLEFKRLKAVRRANAGKRDD